MNALVKEPEPQGVAVTRPSTVLDMIERAARDPNTDVEKFERLVALHVQSEARKSEQAFNDAMSEAQSEMRPVEADANNPQTRSKYASYVALNKAIRPIYTKHGFALSFNTLPDAPEGFVRVVCYVTCVGHSRPYQVDMASDGKGAKGGDVMTKTHAVGSAVTYGMRYLLKMIFNIVVGEDDDDGNGGSAPLTTINKTQIETLQSKLVSSGADIPKFYAFFKIADLPELPAKKYEQAVKMLDAKGGK